MYGTPPDALVGHSAVVVGTELIVWGGGDGKKAHASLNVIDTVRAHLLLRPSCCGPACTSCCDRPPLSRPAIDTRTQVNLLWSRPNTSGSEPHAHVGHSALHADAKMFVFGGYGHRQCAARSNPPAVSARTVHREFTAGRALEPSSRERADRSP